MYRYTFHRLGAFREQLTRSQATTTISNNNQQQQSATTISNNNQQQQSATTITTTITTTISNNNQQQQQQQHQQQQQSERRGGSRTSAHLISSFPSNSQKSAEDSLVSTRLLSNVRAKTFKFLKLISLNPTTFPKQTGGYKCPTCFSGENSCFGGLVGQLSPPSHFTKEKDVHPLPSERTQLQVERPKWPGQSFERFPKFEAKPAKSLSPSPARFHWGSIV